MNDVEDMELTPQKACEIATRLYGHKPIVERFWSVVNNVYLLRFSQGLPERVMKGAKSDPLEILREQQVIPALAARGFPVPQIEKTQADFPDPCPAFTIMPRVGQQNLGELYHAGADRAVMRSLFGEIGSLLARLHAMGSHEVPAAVDEQAARQRARREWSSALGRIRQISTPIARIGDALDASRKWLEEAPLCFTHGDCHPGNVVLADGKRFIAIDWGNAGAGFDWSDLGRCLAITSLYYGDWQWIREGYLAKRTLSPKIDLRAKTWMCLTLLDAGWEFIKDPDSPKAQQVLAQVQRDLPTTFD